MQQLKAKMVAMLRDTCFLYLRSLHFKVMFTSTQMCILIFVTSYLPKKWIGLKPRKGCVLAEVCFVGLDLPGKNLGVPRVFGTPKNM